MTDAIAAYVGWAGDGYARVKMSEVTAHLDETWFAWMGGIGSADPFYYRLHSPVVLIEFEHLPGVAFNNPDPSRHHIHTVIQAPNGGYVTLPTSWPSTTRASHTRKPVGPESVQKFSPETASGTGTCGGTTWLEINGR